MKTISELAKSSIINNRKDALATKISIFLAVVLLGTIIFIIGSIKVDEHKYIVSTLGDYQVSISDVDKSMLESIFDNDKIEKVSFDKYISTDLNGVIIEKRSYFKNIKGFKILSGRNISKENELIAPSRFFQKHKDYKLGSKLKVKNEEYVFVGEYNNYGSSFEESALIGFLDGESKENILKNVDGLEVLIWYKNPRDTYTLTKNFLMTCKLITKKL